MSVIIEELENIEGCWSIRTTYDKEGPYKGVGTFIVYSHEPTPKDLADNLRNFICLLEDM